MPGGTAMGTRMPRGTADAPCVVAAVGCVMAGLVPAIHDLRRLERSKSWMAGLNPAMTHSATAMTHRATAMTQSRALLQSSALLMTQHEESRP
jgi:hypothetical protein